MKFFTSIFLFIFSVAAFAATPGYEISLEILSKGNPKTTGKIRVKEGNLGSLSNNGMEVEVIAKEGEIEGRKGILMNFVVKKNNEVLARPEILVYEKKQGQFTVGEKSGEVLSLTVTPTRINF